MKRAARQIVVVRTGVANIASMLGALRRLGCETRVSDDIHDVETAEYVVVPGVGTFAAGMAALREKGLEEPLQRRVRNGRPTLCVCLGMQLLVQESEESAGVKGLGVFTGKAKRFAGSGVRVPQMGWNVVTSEAGGFWAYFANSYCLAEGMGAAQGDMKVGMARYGEEFVACVQDRGMVACQFHPELSGRCGEELIRAWLDGRDVMASVAARGVNVTHGTGVARVIACLDVRGGRVVKGVEFRNLKDSGDPAQLAEKYAEEGADEIVMLDVSATAEERGTAIDTVRRVRRNLTIPLTVGGGVRSADDAGRLLDAGADKISVNSAAVKEPQLLGTLAERFGAQCTVVAIDAQRRSGPQGVWWEVMTRGGRDVTGLDAVRWAKDSAARGAGEILLTSMDRDGTNAGYDVELLNAVSQQVQVPVIASGGAGEPRHLVEALRAGADAVLAASIFHEGRWNMREVKRVMSEQGVQVRGENRVSMESTS